MPSVDELEIDHDFSSETAGAPDKVDATKLDTQLTDVKNGYNLLLTALDRVIGDDDTLRAGVVRLKSLHTEVAELIASKAGWQPRMPCEASTTGNITLSNPGTNTFDDVALSNGDRLLVQFQTTASQNGVYVFNGSSSALTRATDCDTAAELGYAAVTVLDGTDYGNKAFVVTLAATDITLGTTSIEWAQFGGGGGGGGGGGSTLDLSTAPVTATNSTTSRTLPARFADATNVKDFGAKGDGSTDDTAAIQAAIDSTNAADVYFPPGTYIVSPDAGGEFCIKVKANQTLRGAGMGVTTLKLKNNAGPYKRFLSDYPTATDVSNLEIRDLTIDSNISNNAIANGAEIANSYRHEIAVYTGTNIAYRRVRVKNSSSLQSLVVNGSTVRKVMIEDCIVETFGDDPNHVAHDASVIYVHGYQAIVRNNTFIAAARAAAGATTAIEMHGEDHIVTGNLIVDFKYGILLTGVTRVDSEAVVCSGNTIRGCLVGIDLWSLSYSTHTSGYGLNGVVVANNSIRINQNDYADNSTHGGVYFDPTPSLDIRNVVITGNTIVYDFESVSKPHNNVCIAIGLIDSVSHVTVENVKIQRNILENAPVAGIRFAGSNLKNVDIQGNKLLNCATGLDGGGSSNYRYPFFIYGYAALESVTLKDNDVVDSLTTSRLRYGIYYGLQSGTGKNNKIISNRVKATGTTTTSFLGWMSLADSNAKPFLGGEVDNFSKPANYTALGSRVLDPTTNFEWINTDGAATWVGQGFATTPPGSGTWTKGSIFWNTAPGYHDVVGWLCYSGVPPE